MVPAVVVLLVLLVFMLVVIVVQTSRASGASSRAAKAETLAHLAQGRAETLQSLLTEASDKVKAGATDKVLLGKAQSCVAGLFEALFYELKPAGAGAIAAHLALQSVKADCHAILYAKVSG